MPKGPHLDLDVALCGVTLDGDTDDRAALQKCIDVACDFVSLHDLAALATARIWSSRAGVARVPRRPIVWAGITIEGLTLRVESRTGDDPGRPAACHRFRE